MDPFQNLKSLQDRKQKLLLECEVNRQVLGLEAEIIRLRVSQWKGNLGGLPDVWKLIAPVGGWVLADQLKGKKGRLLVAAALGVALFPTLRHWWGRFASNAGKGRDAAQNPGPQNSASTR